MVEESGGRQGLGWELEIGVGRNGGVAGGGLARPGAGRAAIESGGARGERRAAKRASKQVGAGTLCPRLLSISLRARAGHAR